MDIYPWNSYDTIFDAHDWLIDGLYILFYVQLNIFFNDLEMLLLTVKGCKIQAYALHSGPLSIEGIFILAYMYLLWHQTSIFQVSSEGPPHSAASNETQRNLEDLY
jgi:hypothetical protein